MDVYSYFELVERLAPPVRLDVGQPDVPPPEELLEELRRLLRFPYGPSQGLEELRERIAAMWKVDPYEVAVTVGAKQGLAALLHAFRHAPVKLYSPYYPGYMGIARVFGVPLDIRVTSMEDMWEPVPSGPGTYIVNYPNNPTGIVPSRERFRAIVEEARFVISDEVYRWVAFEEAPSALDYGGLEKVAVVDSFSKALSIPGLRLGYVVSSRDVIRRVREFVAATSTSPPTGPQLAVARSFDVLERRRAELSRVYSERAAAFLSKLRLPCVRPMGTFYVFPRVGCSGLAFAERLLSRGISVFPGTFFGAEDHIRVSLVQPLDVLLKAADVINSTPCA